MNRPTGAASAGMALLPEEGEPAGKTFTFSSRACSSHHTRGHWLWLVTERVRFWIRAAGMSFLRWVSGVGGDS